MNRILKNLVKNVLSNSSKVNKDSYLGGGLVKGLSFEDGGFVPNSGEIKKRALIKKLMELDKPIKEKPLFPHLIGDDQKLQTLAWFPVDSEGKVIRGGAFDDMIDMWLNKERTVMYDGKPYIFSGKDIVGNIMRTGKNIDSTFETSSTFVAKNPDNPEDHILVSWGPGSPENFLEYKLMNTSYEKMASPDYNPDTLDFKNPAHQIKLNRYKDEQGNIKLLQYEDIY